MIRKTSGKEEWCVFDKAGTKKLGCHPTEAAAKAQLAAIEASKHQHSYSQRLEGIEIFAAGKHNGDEYTEADLDAMVEAFGALDFRPPLKAGHVKDTPGMPALGWIDNLRREGSKLVADFIDMPDLVFNAIKDKLYNTVSAEVYWNFERAGKKFHRALKAVALLGADIPAVANLRPLHEMFDDKDAEVHYGEDYETKDYAKGNIQALIDSFGDWAGDSFARCVEHLTGKDGIDDPNKLCAWMHKQATGEWPAQKHSQENIMNEEELKKFVGDAIAAAIAPVAASIADIAKAAPKVEPPLTSDDKAQRIAELTEASNKAEAARKAAADALAAAQTEAEQTATRIKTLEEESRRNRIEAVVESCRIPALRPFVRQYADLASREKDVHVYDAAGNKKPAMSELEQFIGYVNANAARLFSVVSVEDPNRKGAADPGEEVDRRIQQYRAEHPKATQHEALHAVLDADPVLKADYAQAS